MNGVKFAQGMQILPILGPSDIVATATKTNIVDLKYANWATLVLNFGAITCDPPTVTVKVSTANTTTSAIQIAFNYRLSDNTASTSGWGAVTAATTTGVALAGAAADNNKVLLIDVDPAAVAAEGADYRYIHALITPDANATVTIVGALAFLEPKYPANNPQDVITT
jgi:hypothetical protein